jgi:phosphoribosylamine--glycine ligase
LTGALSDSTRALKVLVVGNGAREHAIAWKLAQSPRLGELLVAPGNAGTAQVGANIAIDAEDIDGLLDFARDNSVDFTVIGPEVPLAAGIVDKFSAAGLAVFGPTQAAARIESSKYFAKELMLDLGVPTGDSSTFDSYEEAREHVERSPVPVVVKADGLAAGKAVVIAKTRQAAVEALWQQMVDKRFGSAGDRVVVEEFLTGQEISVFAFVDGLRVSQLAAACDYKQVGEGDTGPNTGGIGAYSPPTEAFWGRDMERRVRAEIVEPVVRGLAKMGSPFTGVLYAGLMITADGPKVIEFNCRLGDPEAQVILPRLKTDLLEVMIRAAEGDVSTVSLEWDERPCVGVVVASGGYPGKYATGYPIEGLDTAPPNMIMFHAGTDDAQDGGHGMIVTSGGRVLTVAALGDTLEDARRIVYAGVDGVRFKDSFYRGDIAHIV